MYKFYLSKMLSKIVMLEPKRKASQVFDWKQGDTGEVRLKIKSPKGRNEMSDFFSGAWRLNPSRTFLEY